MTREEAIELLDQSTQAAAIKKAGGGWFGVNAVHKALDMAISALRAQEELSAPLTLDELRKMGREPVWIQQLDKPLGIGRYKVLDTYIHELNTRMTADGGLLEYDSYGKAWLAYRRKPEEGTS